MHGRPVQRATVADFLADNNWDLGLILPAEDQSPPPVQREDLGDRIDAADEFASVVHRQLDEREHVLRDRYPTA